MSEDGAGHRQDNYSLTSGRLQGAGAGGRGGARRVDVVEEEDLRGNPGPSRDEERLADVVFPLGEGKSRLGTGFTVPVQDGGGEGPPRMARKGAADQGGEIVSPPEILEGADRNRHDRRTERVREQVRPASPDGIEKPGGECRRQAAPAAVLRRPDGLPDGAFVGEKRQDADERSAGRPAGELLFGKLGPVPGGCRKIGRRGWKERAQR
jgi:hypothetical protein